MSDKPVYQTKRFDEIGWRDITLESYKNCELAQTVLETRILYPASVVEALKAENEKLKAHYEGALDSIREHQQICNDLKAEIEVLRKKIEDVANVLGCQSALDKLEIVDRITSALVPPKNGDSK